MQESLEEDKYLVDIICSYDNTFLETGDFSMTAELTMSYGNPAQSSLIELQTFRACQPLVLFLFC